MKIQNHAVMLCYNLPDTKITKLKAACVKLGIRMKRVEPEQFTLPLGFLLGHKEYADALPTDENLFRNEMLVFYQFTELQLDRFLPEIRKAGSVSLKAIVTPTNISWNGCALIQELSAEHEALAQNRKAHTQEPTKEP